MEIIVLIQNMEREGMQKLPNNKQPRIFKSIEIY